MGQSLQLRDADGHRLYLESWLWDAPTRAAFVEAIGGATRTRRLPASWSCATRTPTNPFVPNCTRGSTRRCPRSRRSRRATRGPSGASGTPTGSAGCSTPGYAGLHWPKEYGGRGASPTEQLIFYEETARARAPYVGVNFVGTLHAGPTLIEEGTDAQKAEHLPQDPARRRGVVPGLLRTRRRFRPRVAAHARRCATATTTSSTARRSGARSVRSPTSASSSCAPIPEAPKNRGISWLILPMDLPGIEVRPLKTVLGSSEFAEVFLTDVRVPVANRVGDENDGWRVTNVTLKYERGTAFVSELVDSIRLCEDLAPTRRIDAADIAHELGRCIAEFDALWALTKRNVSQSTRGTTGPGRDGDEARVLRGAPTLRRAVPAGAATATRCTSTTTSSSRNACARSRSRSRPARRRSSATSSASACSACPGSRGRWTSTSPTTRSRSATASRRCSQARVPIERVRAGFDRALFDELAAAGVFSLRADGFSWADCVVVFEQLGRYCVPGPLVASLLARRRPDRGRRSPSAPTDLGRASRRARRAVRRRRRRRARASTRRASTPTRRRGRSIRARRSRGSTSLPAGTPADIDRARVAAAGHGAHRRVPTRSRRPAAPSWRSRTPRSGCSSTAPIGVVPGDQAHAAPTC